MKLSTRLKISFCIMILVPVVLFSAALFGITKYQISQINTKYNTSGTSYEALSNPVVLVSNICRSEYDKLTEAAADEPWMFHDDDFLNNINTELKKRCAFLIIEENGQCRYGGSDMADRILGELNEIDFGDNQAAGIYLGDSYQVIVNRISYTMNNGTTGSAYIIMQIQELIPQMRMLLVDGVIAIIIILILTSTLITTWIYKETVNPINKLKLATHNIKNGNLDFDISVKGRDEISELCRDFDDMRVRLKENADEKIRSDAEAKELISNISHDLKTPITAIKGYVEGIMDGVADTDEKRDRYIRTIYNKACDMDRLINELTFYSKIDSNKVPYNFVKIYVTDYFNDCADELGMELQDKGIKLEYVNNIEVGTRIIADPEQLKRVVNNIVSNSVKYMDSDNGVVGLTITEDKDKVYIDLSDNGKGMDEADVPHIFDRFYRTDSSRNSAKGGSGIGLSIVKKIVMDHNGTITATSSPGQGTTMHMTFNKFKYVPQKAEALRK